MKNSGFRFQKCFPWNFQFHRRDPNSNSNATYPEYGFDPENQFLKLWKSPQEEILQHSKQPQMRFYWVKIQSGFWGNSVILIGPFSCRVSHWLFSDYHLFIKTKREHIFLLKTFRNLFITRFTKWSRSKRLVSKRGYFWILS